MIQAIPQQLTEYEYNYIVRVRCIICGKSKDFIEKRKALAYSQPSQNFLGDLINSCLWGCNKKKK